MEAYEEARHLLAAAHKDLRAIQAMFNPETFVDEVFGFHAQQAAEKALKAWLTFLKDEYPRTHDLSLLLTLLETRGLDVTPYLELIELNPFAVQYRYEAFDDLGALDRSAMCELIQKVLLVVGSFIDMA